MNPRKLRVGNIVNHDGRQIEIELKHFEDMLHYPNEQRKYGPILLTEEWLIKFGFRDGNKGFADEWNKWFHDNLELEPFMDHFVMYICEYVHIKYVHQLQNIYFALNNKELTLSE